MRTFSRLRERGRRGFLPVAEVLQMAGEKELGTFRKNRQRPMKSYGLVKTGVRFLSAFFVFLFASFFPLPSSFVYAAAPTLGVVSPSSGSTAPNIAKTIISSYSDADGWSNLADVRLLISTSSSILTNVVYLYYDQNTNLLYLRNDANTAWLGGFAPGSANTVENSAVKLNCASTTVSGSGTTLVVYWNLTFKSVFSGTYYTTYLYVKDDLGSYVNLAAKGNYAVNELPQLGSSSPASLVIQRDTPVLLSVSYTDPDGWQNMSFLYLRVNTTNTPVNGFYGYYNRSANKLYLVADSGTYWTGGFAPGSASFLENSYVKVDCSKTTVSGSGTTLTVTWSVVFKSTFMGSKNVYLSAQDKCGGLASWAQKGIAFITEPGTIVGTAGGEVMSSDGRVKLIVPAGALGEYHGLEIVPVSGSLATTGALLLSAVECKPAALAFTKLVSLSYTLAQPEVPGTPVELGLYDPVQAKVVSTGQMSSIAADGYTAAFWLDHFSTYAALKNLVSQGAPIGAGVKIPLPDMLTGAFGSSWPIAMPPGRKGMQPGLGLSYRSSGSNSWLGMGMSLNPGHIVRSTRLGPPSYDDTKDTFYFMTDAGTTELVHLVDNLYQAKVESAFTKFYKEPDGSWRAVSKDGAVLKFGEAPQAREESLRGTFSWYLTKAEDTNGNYLSYSYTKDQGKVYLSRVDYTAHTSGVLPLHSVEFLLEPREDVTSSYSSTSKITTALRLKEILVKTNSILIWRYVLTYAASPDTGRSLLVSVARYAADGSAWPAQTLVYQKANGNSP